MMHKPTCTSLFQLPFLVGTHENVVDWIIHKTLKRDSLSIIPGTLHEVAQSQLSTPARADYKKISIYTTDGMPLVWLARWLGFTNAQRVYGPDLFRSVLAKTNKVFYTHAFYGGTPSSLTTLLQFVASNAPEAQVVYAHAPAFSDSPHQNMKELQTIQKKQPHFLWVGLGGHKQVQLLAEWQKKLPHTTCIGIGAAFDFVSGVKYQAPKQVQQLGLEWLFRLFMEPHRLWKRYLVTIPLGLIRTFFSAAGQSQTLRHAVVLKYGTEATVCDYVDQTTRVLAHTHTVIQLSISGHTTWKDTLRYCKTLCAVIIHGSPQVMHLTVPRILPFRSWRFMKKCDEFCAQQCTLWLVHYCTASSSQKIIWNFYPQLADWCLALKEHRDILVFDVVDIYRPPKQKDALTVYIKALLHKANVVTAISRTARAELLKIAKTQAIHLVPQGFDSDSLPAYTPGKKVFVAGYLGAINGRIDVTVMLSCITHMPTERFLFIGPLSSDNNVPQQNHKLLLALLRQPNVTWVPALSRSKALSLMQLCTVALIPYNHRLPFNITSYPMKVLEYFALGLPVLSTPLPELMRHSEHIHFSDSGDGWISTLQALKKVKSTHTARDKKMQIALAQTWEKKIGKILQLIKERV